MALLEGSERTRERARTADFDDVITDTDLRKAYRYLESGAHFGKVVIHLGD